MLQKQHSIVITFDTTASAVALEKFCQDHNLPGRLCSLPAALHAGCGLCYKAPAEAEDQIMALLDANEDILWAELYELDF